jgi:hypothetical protein
MTALIPDKGTSDWDGIPDLATCSYDRYQRAMGTAVRITRYALRGVALPDPRYTDRDHWPVVRPLIPPEEIFHKGLPPAEFAARYRQGLNVRAAEIWHGLSVIPMDPPPAPRRLVLLCHEDVTAGDPYRCHRMVFAGWWQELTGRDVPELTE